MARKWRLAADDSTQRAHEAAGRDALLEVAVGAGADRREHGLARRLEAPDDRRAGAALRKPRDGLDASVRLEVEIDERDVRTVDLDCPAQLAEIGRDDDLEVALAVEQCPDAGAEDPERLGDEDSPPRHRSACSCSRLGDLYAP